MAVLTEAQVELMRGKNFAAVAALREDGTPQTSIVWIDTDGEHVVFNTTNWRAKGKHLRRDPRVSVSVFDAEDPYRYFEVEGVAELELAGADEHINELSRKYRGIDFHTPHDRVIVKVKPERIFDYQVS
ncbi:MAG: PPOX class F420-dependent oxidoreductase [Gaiellaceae bacterium]